MLTQTEIDPKTAKEPELRAWLATLPCPADCNGTGKIKGLYVGGVTGNCRRCEATGLALPWASELCRPCFVCPEHGRGTTVDEDGCCVSCGADAPGCDGGRVPKDVGLVTLFEHGIVAVKRFAVNTFKAQHASDPHMWTGDASTATLAALQAVAASVAR